MSKPRYSIILGVSWEDKESLNRINYAFFIRHVNGLRLDNVHVRFMKDDQRPEFILDNVSDAEMNSIKAQTPNGNAPLDTLRSNNVKFFQSFGLWEKVFKKVIKEKVQ